MTIFGPKSIEGSRFGPKKGQKPALDRFWPKLTILAPKSPKKGLKPFKTMGPYPWLNPTPETVYVFEKTMKNQRFQKRTQSLGSGSPPQIEAKCLNLETPKLTPNLGPTQSDPPKRAQKRAKKPLFWAHFCPKTDPQRALGPKRAQKDALFGATPE